MILGGADVLVMQSFSAMRATTNPYLKQLVAALDEQTDGHTRVRTFSWRDALLGRFDVLHVHWPELLMRSDSPMRTWARRAALLALLARIRFSRRALVRTLHNASPHESGSLVERALLGFFDRCTTLFIALVPSTVPPVRSTPVVVIPHGDYRGWFAGIEVPPAVPGRLGYVGLLRQYKGIDVLLAAFRDSRTPGLHLRIVGKASDAALAATVVGAAAGDDRITARLEYVSDSDLAAEVGRSELIVLPYRRMENSGAALLALSLRRPVLVPHNEVTAALAAEVGPRWVSTFDGELTAAALDAAVHKARQAAQQSSQGPDLSARGWPASAAAHLAAYRRALRCRRFGTVAAQLG